MNKTSTFALLVAFIFSTQTTFAAPRKVAVTNKPVCSAKAICFSGEVAADEEFHKAINGQLEFELKKGWTIEVVSQHDSDCDRLASVVTGPYRYHNDLDIDTSYDSKAEDEVSASPRKFNFVTNCKDYRIESKRLEVVMWPYSYTEQESNKALDELGSSPLGIGRLWITDSRISHSSDTPDNKCGKIEWMRFTVEIRLPHQQPGRRTTKAR